MTLAAAYAPPLRASIWPAALKRTMTARSVNPAAAPSDSPVTASSPVPFGVASNCAVNDPVCAVNRLFCHVSELALHPGGSPCTVTAALPLARRRDRRRARRRAGHHAAAGDGGYRRVAARPARGPPRQRGAVRILRRRR